jgi:hypothetical protein
MGNQVIRLPAAFAAAVALLPAPLAAAPDAHALAAALLASADVAAAPAPAGKKPYGHAVGTDLFFSTDAEHTDVLKAGLNFDWRHEGPEKYLGFRLEKAWFKPLGQGWRGRERAYVRAADSLGKWKWNATVGSDGHTVLGSAGIHDEARFRKEFFVEREILETPQGLKRGIYYTFAGAALDLPANDRNVLTLVAGAQDFTGDNLRTHLRATYVHVLKPNAGLSVQLRTRYFHDSVPHEYDYYSPRWYVQAVPLLQMRRFTDSGWRYLVAGGVGVQRDSDTHWRRSSYFNAQVTSPPQRGLSGNAALLFSETPTTAGNSYNYLQLTAGLTRAF